LKKINKIESNEISLISQLTKLRNSKHQIEMENEELVSQLNNLALKTKEEKINLEQSYSKIIKDFSFTLEGTKKKY